MATGATAAASASTGGEASDEWLLEWERRYKESGGAIDLESLLERKETGYILPGYLFGTKVCLMSAGMLE